ncbi:MAG: hypothetical protein RMX65_035090 [Nostoc sp. DedQUE01]|nr:hypothetical protein [Nostoc sp. DedQUE01]
MKLHNKQVRSLFSNPTINKCDRYFQILQQTSAITIFKSYNKQVRSLLGKSSKAIRQT